MTTESIALHVGFVLIGFGMLRLGKQDPRGFLYQAAGAFLMAGTGFFLEEGSGPIIFWNVVFGLVGLSGYRRLSRDAKL